MVTLPVFAMHMLFIGSGQGRSQGGAGGAFAPHHKSLPLHQNAFKHSLY